MQEIVVFFKFSMCTRLRRFVCFQDTWFSSSVPFRTSLFSLSFSSVVSLLSLFLSLFFLCFVLSLLLLLCYCRCILLRYSYWLQLCRDSAFMTRFGVCNTIISRFESMFSLFLLIFLLSQTIWQMHFTRRVACLYADPHDDIDDDYSSTFWYLHLTVHVL